MEPGSIQDFRGLPRSPDTSLNCAKIKALLSFPLPPFSEWLLGAKRHSKLNGNAG
jgi:hypothetical protein